MIGKRLLLARKASGLSMQALGQAVGVSANMIKKYEHDKSMPSSDVMLKLTEALATPMAFFFRPMVVELSEVEYRKKSNTPVKLLKRIESDVIDQAERWLELANLWSNFPIGPLTLNHNFSNITELADIDKTALELRKFWKLGTNPIPHLIDLLESKGILVIITDVDKDHKNAFDGLQAKVNNLPIIVVSANWTGDRQRFTLAHELGHLILHERLPKYIDEEKACDRFASAFLLPATGAFEHFGKTRKNISPRELNYIKHEYGLSMQACLYRCKDLKVITEGKYTQMAKLFSMKGWRKCEPGKPYVAEQTYLFEQLVHRALSEGILTESKSAELLKLSVFELQQQRNMQTNICDT